MQHCRPTSDHQYSFMDMAGLQNGKLTLIFTYLVSLSISNFPLGHYQVSLDKLTMVIDEKFENVTGRF